MKFIKRNILKEFIIGRFKKRPLNIFFWCHLTYIQKVILYNNILKIFSVISL